MGRWATIWAWGKHPTPLPSVITMNYQERRALAAERLNKLAKGENPYTQQTEQAKPRNQRAADSAIDRGLTQWWA